MEEVTSIEGNRSLACKKQGSHGGSNTISSQFFIDQ